MSEDAYDSAKDGSALSDTTYSNKPLELYSKPNRKCRRCKLIMWYEGGGYECRLYPNISECPKQNN